MNNTDILQRSWSFFFKSRHASKENSRSDTAFVTNAIRSDECGRVCFQGVSWLALSHDSTFIPTKEKVLVKGREGNVLIVDRCQQQQPHQSF